MVEPQSRITVHYPTTTLVTSQPSWRRRELIVKRVRDLVAEPLTLEEYLRRPLTRRGRWLVSGTDTETGQFRQFYLATTREHFRELPLRVGLYEPGGKRPLRLLSRAFRPEAHDRILLGRAASLWSRQDWADLRLGIFADDLRLVAD